VINSQHHNHTLLCINIYSSHRHLHSFPTRRSSDLEATSTKIIFETVDQSISISRLNDSTSRYIFKKRETRSSCLSDKTSCASGYSFFAAIMDANASKSVLTCEIIICKSISSYDTQYEKFMLSVCFITIFD